MFLWYGLPWHELTPENMFEKADLLKKIDKNAIRFTNFVQLQPDSLDSDRTTVNYVSKMQEKLARMNQRKVREAPGD